VDEWNYNRIPSLHRNDASRREADHAAGLPSLGGGVCAIAGAHAALRAPWFSRIVSPARSTAHARRRTLSGLGSSRSRMHTQLLNTAHVRPQAPGRHAMQLAPCAWRSQRGSRVQVKHAFMYRVNSFRTYVCLLEYAHGARDVCL
jgi:hypothetical protein